MSRNKIRRSSSTVWPAVKSGKEMRSWPFFHVFIYYTFLRNDLYPRAWMFSLQTLNTCPGESPPRLVGSIVSWKDIPTILLDWNQKGLHFSFLFCSPRMWRQLDSHLSPPRQLCFNYFMETDAGIVFPWLKEAKTRDNIFKRLHSTIFPNVV